MEGLHNAILALAAHAYIINRLRDFRQFYILAIMASPKPEQDTRVAPFMRRSKS